MLKESASHLIPPSARRQPGWGWGLWSRSHATSPDVLRKSRNRAGMDSSQVDSAGSSPPEMPKPDRGFFETHEGTRKSQEVLQEHSRDSSSRAFFLPANTL